MKFAKVLVILGMAAFMLFGCGKQETSENKQGTTGNEYFEVENLKWGMTVEEALKALDTSVDKVAKYDKYTYGAYFELKDGRELFGEKTKEVHVEFIDVTVSEAEPKLGYLMIEYGENADMAKVLENVKKTFGETSDTMTKFNYMRSGLDSADGDRETATIPRSDYEASDTVRFWESKTLNEVIPKDKSDTYEDLFETSFLWLSDKSWDEFKDNVPLVSVICSSGENEYGYAENTVIINAYTLLAYNTWTEVLEN